ncbi:glycosyltransferase family 2 protein [Aeromonas simiae]|uniref:Glycosyltransferase family 2 protein n=2 Tax=Aeromonas simiae TaxID=218936 RepID=A0A5J6X215_9GAMM|nr:glycosyltransferase family 2 protein [Aeromonas simiae]
MLDVSVLICTYNREAMLVDTIRDVLNQTYPSFEVIVVDQTASHQPETQAYLASVQDRIKLFHQAPSLTKARNRALREAAGRILIFIDDDVRLSTHFIQEHVNAHQAGYTVVQGRVVVSKDADKRPAQTPPFMNGMIKVTGRNDCQHKGATNTLTGCNFSIEQGVVERVGYFDEYFQQLAIREDADYGLRCYRAGEKMIFWPQAELEHLRSDSGGVDTGISNHFFAESYYRNELYFAHKHFSRFVVWLYQWRLKRRFSKNLKRLQRSLHP